MMFQSDIVPIVVIVIISFALGIIFGLLLAALRHSEYPAPPKEVLQKKLKQLVRLWGNEQDEVVLIETSEDIFHHLGEKTDKQKQILTHIISALSQEVAADIPVSELPLPDKSAEIGSVEEGAKEQRTVVEVADAPKNENLQPPVKRSFIDLLARANQAATSPVVNEPKSIAAQVDEILQRRIQGTELESRAIRLMELPGKGMVVMIGLDQYDSVNEVPDPEIQQVLRAAVGEWEEKMFSSNL